MTQQPKNRAADDEGAWLEEALLLAASELSAFRASAQAERERMQRAHDTTRARVQALEEQQRQSELRHANEMAETRTLLEVQLGQRAKVWAEFSKDLSQRMASINSVKFAHAREVEESSALRRQLTDLRAQLTASETKQREVEELLGKQEEAFAGTAQALQRTRAELVNLTTQRDDAVAEQRTHAARQAELVAGQHALEKQLAQAETLRKELETGLEQATAAQSSLRARISVLEETSREHQRLTAVLVEAKAKRESLETELAGVRGEVAQAKRGSESAQHAAQQAQKAVEAADELAKQAHGDMLAARRERDEVRQTLEVKFNAELGALRTERDQMRLESDRLQAERGQLRGEIEEQASTRWAMLDLEKQRSAKFKSELDHARAELEPMIAERDQLQAEREAVRVQFEQLRSERDRLSAEVSQLRTDRERLVTELENIQNAQTAAIDVRAIRLEPVAANARDHATVPMPIPDIPPANRAPVERAQPVARSREGSSYSYSEVAEEQVFVPLLRSPNKGGGRGGQ